MPDASYVYVLYETLENYTRLSFDDLKLSDIFKRIQQHLNMHMLDILTGFDRALSCIVRAILFVKAQLKLYL